MFAADDSGSKLSTYIALWGFVDEYPSDYCRSDFLVVADSFDVNMLLSIGGVGNFDKLISSIPDKFNIETNCKWNGARRVQCEHIRMISTGFNLLYHTMMCCE